jgi:hypothetical protein
MAEFELQEALMRHDIESQIEKAGIEDVKGILGDISNIPTETEKALLIERLSKRLGVAKRPIEKDLKTFSPGTNKTAEQLEKIAHFPGLVDIVADDQGDPAFLVKDGGSLVVAKEWGIEGRLYTPPGKESLPFLLPRGEEVMRWCSTDTDRKMFEATVSHLKRFSYLPEEIWVTVVCTVLLSYIQEHPDVHYMPMLLFWAVPERGKSRTGKAVSYVTFRGIHLVDLREANLFRYSENLRASLFFDLMDLWKTARNSGSQDILLLRFEKGATVSRVLFPEKGAFDDMKFYNIYGPTIIATNEPVHKILGTRCIPITMPNKPGNYENPTPEKAREIKERLVAWRARTMSTGLPEIETVSGISGRLWDITKPLFQVCTLVYPEKYEGLKAVILDVAGERIQDRQESAEGRIVSIIKELYPEGLSEWEVPTSDILARLNDGRPDDRKYTPEWLGKKLSALGFPTRKTRGTKVRSVSADSLNTLLSQYCATDAVFPSSPLSPSSPNQGLSTEHRGDSDEHSCELSPNYPRPESVEDHNFGDVRDSVDSAKEDGDRENLALAIPDEAEVF